MDQIQRPVKKKKKKKLPLTRNYMIKNDANTLDFQMRENLILDSTNGNIDNSP